MSLIGAAAIGAGMDALFGTIGSGIGAGIKNKNSYDYTRRLIKDQENSWKVQADYANDIAIDNWNMQNAYNSPENQRKLYEAAGLNPALLYSGGASGVSGAGSVDGTPSASMPSGSFNAAGPEVASNLVAKYYAFKDAQATIDLKESQARENDSQVIVNQTVSDLNDAKTLLTQSQTLSTNVKREIDQFNLDFLEDTRFINIQQAATNLYKTQAATQALIDAAALDREKLKREPLMRAQIQANIENFAFTQAVAMAQVRLMNAGTRVSYAELTKIAATVRNLDAQTGLTGQTTELRSKEVNWFSADRVNDYVNTLVNALTSAVGVATIGGVASKGASAAARGFHRDVLGRGPRDSYGVPRDLP